MVDIEWTFMMWTLWNGIYEMVKIIHILGRSVFLQ